MTSPARSRFVRLLGVVGGALIASAQACSLDWGVRPDPGDGAVAETSLPDVFVVDTGIDAPPGDAPDDSPSDPDANGCGALTASVAKAKIKAKECELGMGQCTATVLDECGCQVVVRGSDRPENTAYTKAVAALVADCGPPSPKCDVACKSVGLPASWGCLQPGASPECTP